MSDKKMVTHILEGSFTVTYRFEFEAREDATEREIVERLCNKDIFTYHGGYEVDAGDMKLGLDPSVLKYYGIRAQLEDWDGDPSPTGRERTVRDWRWSVDERGDE
jgi:hypothetical protein